jgi:polysaccharide export outer membrane protein
MKTWWLTGLAAMVSATAVGCKFDQGPRMELAEFLQRVNEEDEEEAKAQEAVPDLAQLQVLKDRTYQVGPSDVVEINVVGLYSPKQPYSIVRRIRNDGKIVLPMVEGEAAKLNVDGLTADQIEQKVYEIYSAGYVKDPQVTVLVRDYKTTPVVVIGQVNNPGLTNLRRDELNLLTAVAKAGWLREVSNGKVVLKPAKGGKEEYMLWHAPDISRAMSRSVELGDVVEVERRPTDSIFVTGLVRGGGPISVPVGTKMSFQQAIASSGGLKDDVDPREATLIRLSANGEPLRVRIDLNRIYDGSDPTFYLKPGDVIDVYHTDRTRTLEMFNRLIRLGAGAGLDMTYNPFMFGAFGARRY